MSHLFLPAGVAESVLAEKAGRDEAERVFGHVVKRLKAIDSRLGMFLCDQDDPDNELRAGFYYVTRRNDTGHVDFWEVSDDGRYVEPGEVLVQAFQRWDANAAGNTAWDRQKRRDADARRKEKRKQDREELRAWKLKDETDYAFRIQVPVKDGVPQNRAERRKKAA